MVIVKHLINAFGIKLLHHISILEMFTKGIFVMQRIFSILQTYEILKNYIIYSFPEPLEML